MLIYHMATGRSFESFAAKVNVCFDTLYYWQNKYPQFKEAHLEGKAKALEFFEGKLLEGIKGERVGAALLNTVIKARFHKIYGDVHKHQIEAKTTVEQLIESAKDKDAIEAEFKEVNNESSRNEEDG